GVTRFDPCDLVGDRLQCVGTYKWPAWIVSKRGRVSNSLPGRLRTEAGRETEADGGQQIQTVCIKDTGKRNGIAAAILEREQALLVQRVVNSVDALLAAIDAPRKFVDQRRGESMDHSGDHARRLHVVARRKLAPLTADRVNGSGIAVRRLIILQQ